MMCQNRSHTKLSRARVVVVAATLGLCSLFTGAVATAQEEAAPPNPNAVLVMRLVNEVWNGGSMEVLDEIMAPTYMSHGPSHDESKDLGEFRTFVEAMRAAFPDLTIAAEQVIAGEDRMAVAWRATGTNSGDLDEIPATGQPATIVGVTLYRFEGGRIAESWYAYNEMDLLVQLGLVTAP